jgi:hypothetical protein
MEENNNNNEAHESTINHQHINTEQQQGLRLGIYYQGCSINYQMLEEDEYNNKHIIGNALRCGLESSRCTLFTPITRSL